MLWWDTLFYDTKILPPECMFCMCNWETKFLLLLPQKSKNVQQIWSSPHVEEKLFFPSLLFLRFKFMTFFFFCGATVFENENIELWKIVCWRVWGKWRAEQWSLHSTLFFCMSSQRLLGKESVIPDSDPWTATKTNQTLFEEAKWKLTTTSEAFTSI